MHTQYYIGDGGDGKSTAKISTCASAVASAGLAAAMWAIIGLSLFAAAVVIAIADGRHVGRVRPSHIRGILRQATRCLT